MTTKTLLAFAVLLTFAFVAAAADIDGSWVVKTERNGQTMTQTYKLKADDGKLTGTVSGGRGGEVQISDGKIDGDNVSFTVKREMGGNSMVMNYKGTVSGDELKLSVSRQGGDQPARDIVAKREK